MIEHFGLEKVRDPEWFRLYDELLSYFSTKGRCDPLGKADFFVLDDDWGNSQQKIFVQNEDFLTEEIVYKIKKILERFPNWEVVVQMDLPEWDGQNIPPMGLVISAREIKDDLKKEFLKGNMKNVRF
jgi:hypothetical protein